MGARVFTIERIRALYQTAQVTLKGMGYPVRFFLGDGYQGLPGYAPFDRILVTAGAPSIPEPLKKQLAIGGILVIPVGNRDVQVMTRCIRTGEDAFEITRHGDFVFVPLKEGIE
jgi:protein-L-isoaspartate(D-aspartate) O-methyltransferase